MEESAFGTLEALAARVVEAVRMHVALDGSQDGSESRGYPITIGLEKPVAITFAEAARVEFTSVPQSRAL
jgi:hypothetical protein